jgi:hypothetical protein
MPLTALTDGAGRSFVDPASGRMLVLPALPLQMAASFAAAGGLMANAAVTGTSLSAGLHATGLFRADATIELSKVAPESGLGSYVPLNAFVRRTIVRKRR